MNLNMPYISRLVCFQITRLRMRLLSWLEYGVQARCMYGRMHFLVV